MAKFLATVFALIGAFLLFIVISLFFIKLGWSLFAVPVFALPELTWLQALGFSFLASSFRSHSSGKSS